MQVMYRVQARTEDFLEAVQVVQVAATEMLASITSAFRIQRARVQLVLRVLDLDVAILGEQHAVARVARRHHAIEHIYALRHRRHQVFRRTHPHQITRLILRQLRCGMFENALHVLLGFAHRQPADGIAVETDIDQLRQRFVTQIFIHAALHDTEQGVGIALVRGTGTRRPAQRQAHRIRRLPFCGRKRRAFVEDHHDVGIEYALDTHGLFRTQEQFIAIDRRLKRHSFLANLAQRPQTEHLKTARIGEYRTTPAHKPVQAAMRRDDLQPGTQPQVESIAQHDMRADVVQFLRTHRLDRAVSADRHKRRGLYPAVRQRQLPAPRQP